MHFYAQFETFEEALQLATLADFNSNSLAPASYSKTIEQNGKRVKIEAKLGGETGRKIGESQTQISAAYIIQAVEDGQTYCVIDTHGIDMDNQNMANKFGFLCEFDVLHGVGIMLEENDNRATNPFKYCINDGFMSNLHKNGAPNIVFLIIHSSGSGKAIDVVSELLEEVEEKNGVKIPLDESNILCFNNAPFEALCLIKMKGVTYNEKEMRKFSEEWTKSVQEFKRLLKHLATVKPHLTRETLSVCAARSAIADIIPVIVSNGAQIQKSIAKLEIDELEITEWTKTIGEDKKKADIMFENFVKKELGILRMLLHSDSMMSRNVVEDPPLWERVTEMRKEMIIKEAGIKQQLIEERNFCCKEAAKWISCLKSMTVITDDDQMLRYIELSIREAEGKMAKLKGESREEQQKSIEALRKFKEFYIKERTLFETAPNNAEEFEFPTENIEQIFDGLFALEKTGEIMRTNYEMVKKAKREHQRQFTAEEEKRAAKQNLVKAEPTKCQIAEFDV